ncbi:hypothetical protein LTS15_008811 [Exophiala xenobiotica]|nr:hypothetical protein LTS15_008811 [Exophiala xenobiotica]
MPIPWDRYIPGGFQRRQPPLLPIAEVRESPGLNGTPQSQQNAPEGPYEEKSTDASYFPATTSQQTAGIGVPHETVRGSRRESYHPDPFESLNSGSPISYTNEKDAGEHENQPPRESDSSSISDSGASTAVLPDAPLPTEHPNESNFTNPFDDDDKNIQSVHAYNATHQSNISGRHYQNSVDLGGKARNFSLPSFVDNPKGLTWMPDPSTWPAHEKLSISSRPKSSRTLSTISMDSNYPQIIEPKDPARKLSPKNLFTQRCLFFGTIISLNIGCLVAALIGNEGLWIFVFILLVKSKDVLSAVISPCGMLMTSIYHLFKPPEEVPTKWILSLIPAYSESEEQIVKCIYSLRDNGVEPHKQVMCVVLDGKPRDVKSHFTDQIASFKRPYVSFKHRLGELVIHAGFMKDVPVIVIEKKKNGGKKDSLILAHDLFNYPRKNMPLYTKLLREEMWEHVIPILTEGEDFSGFDTIFCTDADSVIHNGALASLTNALARDKNSIAACGLVLVELEKGQEWSFWNLYQQFQYTFGQYVRRRAEHFWGKVTCLPGCITMIKVRPECAGAMEKYAEAITVMPVIHHQVQYLGTDRRLTYSLLSQSRKLTTIFVPEAVSETVAPQSLKHYLSQRRRWGSNAYFNNYFYVMGENMIVITRIAAFVEILRLSMVYYRFCNTVLLVKFIIEEAVNGTFDTMKLVPLLIVSQLPLLWYCVSIVKEKPLRVRAHKLILGFCINKCVSSFMSMTIFYHVARNVGSQVWGMSGVTATSAITPSAPIPTIEVPAMTVPAGMNSTSIPGGAETLVPAAALPGAEAAAIAAAPLDRVATIEIPAIAMPVVAVQVASSPKKQRKVSWADRGPQ